MAIAMATAQSFESSTEGAGTARIQSLPLACITYRSQMIGAQTQRELESVMHHARARNRAEGITGLLIYDSGRMFQWLEGPGAALVRIWRSISADTRHQDIELLGMDAAPGRFYGGSDMHLLYRDALVPPTVQNNAHARSSSHPAPVDLVSALADLSHGVNAETAWNYVRDIRRQGVTIESLYANLLQPAARALGDRWQDDRCSEFEVTIGMGRLQEIAHRLSPEATSLPLRTQAPCTILVAPQPGEKHLLGVAIDSECFWQSGAVVDCKFPTSDVGLCDLLHGRWFDILDLSLSDAYRREHWLSAMTETVRLARSASVNPRLVVTVGGRVFREQPDFCGRVGADASHGSARELVSKARIALAARGADSSNDGSIHASSS